ncbi:MAG: flagellar export chaperone FliS [Sulfuritalea sp.]|jgi:flagellar protein FliS|nr:flagellar export chaperone FliS [Sulfuritalea sp.]
MFVSSRKQIDAYNKVGLETGVDGANPYRLITMLLDGAIFSLGRAAQALREKRIGEKGKEISMAIDIISSGLQASIDLKAGGEIAERLNSLYDYMCTRLLHANLHSDLAAIQEVSSLLGEIKAGWEEIANDPAVASRNKVSA